MNETLAVFAALILLLASSASTTHDCHPRHLYSTPPPPTIPLNVSFLVQTLADNRHNFSYFKHTLINYPQVLGVLVEDQLGLNISGRLRVFPNRTDLVHSYWPVKGHSNGWGRPFKSCLQKKWLYNFFSSFNATTIGLFFELQLDQCNIHLLEIFNGTSPECDPDTTYCVNTASQDHFPEQQGLYECRCRAGFFRGQDDGIQDHLWPSPRCNTCPKKCDVCELNGVCAARSDVYLKTAVLGVQLCCMGVTVVLGLIVFKQRKTKAIATGMWTILETILLGIFMLYGTVVVRFFEPSIIQCLLEPWAREVGFIVCYGAIILKLYRHLIEFRTRKAHRWVVKDTDLLKYLLIMVMSVLAYMAAYTSITMDFLQEDYSLLFVGKTLDHLHYTACKPLWWDYVTEAGELVILIFGIHLSYASRNARTQFHERVFLCAAISIELAVSLVFYIARVLVLPGLHPDLVLIVYCLRTQLSTTLTLLLVFVPKFWYQQKQVRSLAQEYSCRIPVDAFKDVNAHGPLTGNNSDVEVGEITLADMSPDDIRAELKRLYLQLEIFKSKTICRDNPHISKRRGGRKAQHRRFSLQNLHGKHRDKDKVRIQQEETTEAEPSRTPEDSVCSNEGPSTIYADLPSTTH